MFHIQEYLRKCDKDLDENVNQPYEEKFLRYYRVSVDGPVHHVKASCHAAMKKTVSYNIDVKFGDSGEIIEASVSVLMVRGHRLIANMYAQCCTLQRYL